MRHLFVLITLFLSLHSASLKEHKWENGETFLTFLEKQSLPLALYYGMDKEDQELMSEILTNSKYYTLVDDNDAIEQILIPVGEELQIHIMKEKSTNTYESKIIPVAYQEESLSVAIDITLSPYQDIVKQTNNHALANEFISVFKNSLNFKRIQKGDRLVIFYSQRTRLGQRYVNPKIDSAMVEINKRPNYIFSYNDRYYTDNAKEIEGFLLLTPLKYTRISSPFTQKRFHPVLKKYRAHLGIDYAAPTGTHVKSAGNGKVVFVGTKNGYGKTVEIDHGNGYKTLYAHLNGFKKGLKRGQQVSKGELIAYVGNTGVSTGPHLHFGLYKNQRAINPASVVKIERESLKGKEKEQFLVHVQEYKDRIALALLERPIPLKEEPLQYAFLLENPIEEVN